MAAAGCGGGDAPHPGSTGLVFVRAVNGSNEILRVRIADGATRAVTETPRRSERWPYWSQAAGRLVFQVAPADAPGASDLVLWDPESGEETPLSATPRREERWPSWSPDGRLLVFAFLGGRPPGGILVRDLVESETHLVARAGADDKYLRPSFAPDGEAIVAQRRGPESAALWRLGLRAPPRPLTADSAWFDTKPWFTRDGRHVVYSRRPTAGGPHDVVRIAADGGEPMVLACSSDADDHSARPSPARDEIAFVSNRGGSFDAFVADLDGAGLRRLTDTPDLHEFTPRWSPDGERIVLTVGRAGAPAGLGAGIRNPHLVVLDRDGRELLRTPGLMPDWMPAWD